MKILTNRTCTLSHLSIRTETHGDEKVGAADIKIEFTTTNAVLNEFGPGLREALFRAPAPDADVQQLFETPEHLPNLKYPMLKPIGFDDRSEGQNCVIEYGLGGESNIQLSEVSVDKWSVDLVEGGSVSVTARIQCHPEPEDVAKLFRLLDKEITVTISRPAIGEQKKIDAAAASDDAKPKRGRKSKKEADDTDDSDRAFPKSMDGMGDWPFPGSEESAAAEA